MIHSLIDSLTVPHAASVSLHSTRLPAHQLTRHLRSSDGLAGGATALPGVQTGILALNDLGGLLDGLLALGEDQLDVAGVGHVGVDLDCG